MLPLITITDASTAYCIADALRQQADANRRVAEKLARPEFDGLGSAVQRSIEKLYAHAKRLDGLALVCESQGILSEHGDDPTIEFPADATARLAALPML